MTRMAAQHVGRVGALLAPRFEEPHRPTSLQQLIEQEGFGTAGEETVAKFTEDGKVEARVRQVQASEILPVNAGPDRFGRLAVRELFAELHKRDEREPPWGQTRVAPRRKQCGKVLVLENCRGARAGSREGFPLGKAAEATRMVCSGTGAMGCGCKDITEDSVSTGCKVIGSGPSVARLCHSRYQVYTCASQPLRLIYFYS